jgi:hypothetical protein
MDDSANKVLAETILLVTFFSKNPPTVTAGQPTETAVKPSAMLASVPRAGTKIQSGKVLSTYCIRALGHSKGIMAQRWLDTTRVH